MHVPVFVQACVNGAHASHYREVQQCKQLYSPSFIFSLSPFLMYMCTTSSVVVNQTKIIIGCGAPIINTIIMMIARHYIGTQAVMQ